MNLPTPPILFIIFNRPDLTSRVFERIREQRPGQLFIAADGPRASKPDDFNHCYETLEVTRNIDWPCEVHRLERDVNLGCKIGVSTAISWFFERVEQGIILEDDCLPDATFFPYCSELLESTPDQIVPLPHKQLRQLNFAPLNSRTHRPQYLRQESHRHYGSTHIFLKYEPWLRLLETYKMQQSHVCPARAD